MTYKGRGAYHGKFPCLKIKFPGEFKNGLRHGDGLFTYVNKDIYSW